MKEVAATSGTRISSPRRRRFSSLGYLYLIEQQNILNVFKKLSTDNLKMRITAIVARISRMIQFTLYHTIKEYKEKGQFTMCKQTSGRHCFIADCDETDKNSIRQLIHRIFFYKHELPTLDKVLNIIKQHDDMPQMSHLSFYIFTKVLNFRYMKGD